VSTPEESLREMQKELAAIKEGVVLLDSQTLGNYRNREAYKESLQGRVEKVEAQVKEVLDQVGGFKATLNKGVGGLLMAILGAAGLWLFNKLTGAG